MIDKHLFKKKVEMYVEEGLSVRQFYTFSQKIAADCGFGYGVANEIYSAMLLSSSSTSKEKMIDNIMLSIWQ